MTETQVGGTTIPEAVPVEGVVPEAEVLAGAALEPVVTVAPEATQEVHDDALPESSGADPFAANVGDHSGWS
jgi:hypothetical protein